MARIKRPLSGREKQRRVLRRLLRSEKSELLALYGRRRVGKTFLIRRFFQDEAVVYLEMMGQFDGSQRDHLELFAEALSGTFHRGAKIAPPASWNDAFRELRAAIDGKRRRTKYVLFFK